jgi:hypothetical protein
VESLKLNIYIYFFSEVDEQSNNSVPSSVNRESPPVRKIFVGNLSDRVSNTVIYYLFFSLNCTLNVFLNMNMEVSFGHLRRNQDVFPARR